MERLVVTTGVAAYHENRNHGGSLPGRYVATLQELARKRLLI